LVGLVLQDLPVALGLTRLRLTRLRLAQAKVEVHDLLLHIERNVRGGRKLQPLSPIPYARGNSIVFVSFGLGCLVIEFLRYFDIFCGALQATLKSLPPSSD